MQSKSIEVQVRDGAATESESAALEERISTAINDFGCVFTTLTGEKMGSTSTAHSMLIVSSPSLPLSLSRTLTLLVCSFMSPGSASNSIVEPDRLWRYDWPQIQWMIGLWFCRDRAIADSRFSCSLQWTIYSNNTADLHARNPFPWRGTSFHQLIELNFRLDCAIKLIFSVFTWFAFFLVFLPQQVWSRSCAIIHMVYRV